MNTLLFLLVLASATALKLPNYVKKCSIKDHNFNTCALESAKYALPHLIKGWCFQVPAVFSH
ncbi:hypothetical protein L798_03112 [Zootermopsis nevadensis]|uniref:Uncharacterized protein n=1 Tax=Zootermopsis nevadensis TaxID=136037 RepID=A0A067QGY0_ZOONE|nr:hypothetical protein L798_03112 [Zootermopsis nevadensis]